MTETETIGFLQNHDIGKCWRIPAYTLEVVSTNLCY